MALEESPSCPGCGLIRPAVSGAADPYGGASAACWAAFSELLAGDYSHWRPARHRLTVDAYMAQHPGYATPGGRRSVQVHLVGLHLALERELAPPQIGRILGAIFPDKSQDVEALEPVPELAGLTVEHVLLAPPEVQDARTIEWATAVWRAWCLHHGRIRKLAEAASARAHGRRAQAK